MWRILAITAALIACGATIEAAAATPPVYEILGGPTACKSPQLYRNLVRANQPPAENNAALGRAIVAGDCTKMTAGERVRQVIQPLDGRVGVSRLREAIDAPIWYIPRGFLMEPYQAAEVKAEATWPDCGPVTERPHLPIDLNQYVLGVSRKNACRQVEVIVPLGIADDASRGIIEMGGYMTQFEGRSPVSVVVELGSLSEVQRRDLREACPLYDRCTRRWQITLLRHDEGSGLPLEVVRLDGWLR